VTADRLAFDPDEELYRTFAKDQLRRGKIKASALRPQFSVHRSKFVSSAADVQVDPDHSKFNGVAKITVREVRAIAGTHLALHCVDDPTREQPSHALITVSTAKPFGTPLDADFEQVRAALAGAMTVVKAAT
jgi:hypothetical protein